MIGWLGAGIGVLAFAVIIQTMRLGSAKRALAIEKRRAADAWQAQEAAELRADADRAAATEWKQRSENIERTERMLLAKAAESAAAARADVAEIKAAQGDDARVLSVLERAIARAAVPDAGAEDLEGGAD